LVAAEFNRENYSMPKTISTVQLSEYILTSGGNPLSITGSGGVETSGGTAIYGGLSRAWTITNAGTVQVVPPAVAWASI
jgi:hypothetical protein